MKDKSMAVVMVVLLVAIVAVLAYGVYTSGQPTHVTGTTQAVFSNVSRYMTFEDGTDHGTIMLFALSTCPYCNQEKSFLESSGVAYYWIDVDKASPDALITIFSDSGVYLACGTPSGFPVLVADDKCIVGYNEAELLKVISS